MASPSSSPSKYNAASVRSLYRAAVQNDSRSIATLTASGVDVATRADADFLDQGLSPLFYAAEKGNVDAVRALLDAGASPNTKGRSKTSLPLIHFLAAYGGKQGAPATIPAVVQLLIDRGAKWDEVVQGMNAAQAAVASSTGSLGALKLLVAAGADPNAEDATPHKLTPLLTAVACYNSKTGNTDKFEGVLSLTGLDVNRPHSMSGGTALHAAAAAGHVPLIRLLLAAGSDITVKDKAGKSAYDVRHRQLPADLVESIKPPVEEVEVVEAEPEGPAEPPGPAPLALKVPVDPPRKVDAPIPISPAAVPATAVAALMELRRNEMGWAQFIHQVSAKLQKECSAGEAFTADKLAAVINSVDKKLEATGAVMVECLKQRGSAIPGELPSLLQTYRMMDCWAQIMERLGTGRLMQEAIEAFKHADYNNSGAVEADELATCIAAVFGGATVSDEDMVLLMAAATSEEKPSAKGPAVSTPRAAAAAAATSASPVKGGAGKAPTVNKADGHITMASFTSKIMTYASALRITAKGNLVTPRVSEIECRFRSYDNGSGEITYAELQANLKAEGKATTQEQFDAVLRQIDQFGSDGRIEWGEFLTWVETEDDDKEPPAELKKDPKWTPAAFTFALHPHIKTFVRIIAREAGVTIPGAEPLEVQPRSSDDRPAANRVPAGIKDKLDEAIDLIGTDAVAGVHVAGQALGEEPGRQRAARVAYYLLNGGNAVQALAASILVPLLTAAPDAAEDSLRASGLKVLTAIAESSTIGNSAMIKCGLTGAVLALINAEDVERNQLALRVACSMTGPVLGTPRGPRGDCLRLPDIAAYHTAASDVLVRRETGFTDALLRLMTSADPAHRALVPTILKTISFLCFNLPQLRLTAVRHLLPHLRAAAEGSSVSDLPAPAKAEAQCYAFTALRHITDSIMTFALAEGADLYLPCKAELLADRTGAVANPAKVGAMWLLRALIQHGSATMQAQIGKELKPVLVPYSNATNTDGDAGALCRTLATQILTSVG